ncbi:hypothetical protein [Bradyrhizobium sp. S69]|jgi:hypothetical protein|nr:hypothetical protein [Bradyrhizobium sp. S69]
MSSSANGSRECAPDDKLRRMIQYTATPIFYAAASEYWMPAFAGMTVV